MKKVGTGMAKLNITLPQFAICNDNCTKAFEDMCRRLFTAEFLKGKMLPHSDSNNPGVEVLPILEPEREDGQPRKRISFQCKYVDSSANAYSEFQKSARVTAETHKGKLDLVYLFCNKTLTTTSKAYQTIMRIHFAAGIETKPISNDELLDMVAKYDDIAEYYFQQRRIPNIAISELAQTEQNMGSNSTNKPKRHSDLADSRKDQGITMPPLRERNDELYQKTHPHLQAEVVSDAEYALLNDDTDNKINNGLKSLSADDLHPKVFISYSRENEEHNNWVKGFADKLLSNGIEAIVDQYDLAPGDRLTNFMERAISDSDIVIIVCTPMYKYKSDNRQGGVGYEGHIISEKLYSNSNERKFIPILRRGEPAASIPSFLSGKLWLDFREDNAFDSSFSRLLDACYKRNIKPALHSSNYAKFGSTYSLEIVFCIDGTKSMSPVIDIIKSQAVNLYRDIRFQMEKQGRTISAIRTRIVLFRDYHFDDLDAMVTTRFYELPGETSTFVAAINNLEAKGGGDDPESGLEALGIAIHSDWMLNSAGRKRQLIFVWSDADTHPLGHGKENRIYPNDMANDFNELTEWWFDEKIINQISKRLVLFTPQTSWWYEISYSWDCVY